MNASKTVNIVPSTPNVPSPRLESVNQPPMGARRRTEQFDGDRRRDHDDQDKRRDPRAHGRIL